MASNPLFVPRKKDLLLSLVARDCWFKGNPRDPKSGKAIITKEDRQKARAKGVNDVEVGEKPHWDDLDAGDMDIFMPVLPYCTAATPASGDAFAGADALALAGGGW